MGNDDGGFEEWYREQHPRVLAMLTVASGDREIAQDLTAEAFARALERWDRVAAMDAPGGWVCRVAVNLLRRRQRRAGMEARILKRRRPAGDELPPSVSPEVWASVAALPERQRAVVALRVVMDLSQDDTARLLRIRPGTVSATLVAARRTLARDLDAFAPAGADREETAHG